MGGIGLTELILLAVIALLVVGPQRLPEIARTAGQLSKTARGAWQSLKTEFQTELDLDHNRKVMRQSKSSTPPTTAKDDDPPKSE
ncbi:MAG: Sec-independent protein translocase protein TatB [Wenzhouxiangella sp.]|nr:Sec-independent protein translocase protein TatB [Wenzhouxiangella sp.]MDR9453150.1 Sec-independent protein translocase protein TatB [Wenzhouxiangella sp.]